MTCVCLSVGLLAGLHKYCTLDLPGKRQIMGLGPA